MSAETPPRGRVTFEWVDATEEEPGLPMPNFGWFGVETDAPVSTPKLVAVLRAVADHLEEREVSIQDQRLAVGPRTRPPREPPRQPA